MFSLAISATLHGIQALPVHIEVNTGESGDPRLVLVGLPDTAVKESQDRVSSAIQNSGFSMPQTRTTINLAPGDLRKEGPLYDLPIALGILASTGQLKGDLFDKFLIAGELGLSGKCRPVRGALALAQLARLQNKSLILPPDSAEEAALVDDIEVYKVKSLDEAVLFLSGSKALDPINSDRNHFLNNGAEENLPDFSDVKGQYAVRRAVEVAVAGNHNMILIGPPGSGKSMIAKRIPSIMPEPTLDEFLEILSIQSIAGNNGKSKSYKRPYRSPHHTISDVGLLGGGSVPGPGEISLAHNGVLFLDELPEFKRNTLEVLRQPLEDGCVSISRSAGKITLPCSFMLVAAMNPTPCGYSSKDGRENYSSPAQIQKYRSRISGPLLDRIDIHIEAPALSIDELQNEKHGESSADIRERIIKAREFQSTRYKNSSTRNNARMSHSDLEEFCALDKSQKSLLQEAMEELQLSARAYDRVLKVSRTIADLGQSEEIQTSHLMEAIQYRNLDRNVFI